MAHEHSLFNSYPLGNEHNHGKSPSVVDLLSYNMLISQFAMLNDQLVNLIDKPINTRFQNNEIQLLSLKVSIIVQTLTSQIHTEQIHHKTSAPYFSTIRAGPDEA